MNEKRKQTSFDRKLEAVRQHLEQKISVIEIADHLGVHRDTVYRWIHAYQEQGEEGLKKKPKKSQLTPEERRVRELEKQLKQQKLENEILKKFHAFLKENE